ncbi:MAG: hypothetical protein Q4D16_19900 [Eubacteriales bacterium]|nr:hypothetical protein [Eubacteriales bacterium]
MSELEYYPKYVKINKWDLEYAIRKGIGPMTEWVDDKRDGLPYFENYINGSRYGNHHHFTFSAAHTTGRRLEALTIAEQVTGIKIPEEVYRNLEKWAYRVFDNPMKMMSNWNIHTFRPEMVCDLHNLREVMYSFIGLLRRNPDDKKARGMVMHLLEMVDRYTDYEKGIWKEEKFRHDTGGSSMCSVCTQEEGFRFTGSLGRYIEALMRLCQEFSVPEALEQALRLQETFFRTVLDDTGEFNAHRFCSHIHSVTAAICGITMLGDYVQDYEILNRADRFMQKGFYDIAVDMGWSTENDARTDWVGEVNNSCDLMETCLYLGKNGFPGYYGRAEKMLRSHILPSQLLDVSFLDDEESGDNSVSQMASRMAGAFGFPCPYGHEEHPGSEISFNWDINAGGVSGLCQAWRHRVSDNKNFISINLLFNYEDEDIRFFDPYSNHGKAGIFLKQKKTVRIRLPECSNWQQPDRDKPISMRKQGEWLYLEELPVGEMIEIPFNLIKLRQDITFKGKTLKALYQGEQLECISSQGKRLCYFPEYNG